MQLIFVNRFFYPDHSATSQMLSDLAFGLARRGVRITVVTSRLRYDSSAEKLAAHETINGVEIVRIWTSRFGRSGLALRAVDYLTFYVSAGWKLLRLTRRGDILVAMTDPPIISIVAAIVAHLRRARLVNWLQDVFPEVAEALGVGSRASRVAWLLLRPLRNASLRMAHMNVVIGELMANRVRHLGVARDRVTVIANWADTDAVRPIPAAQNKLRAAWGLSDKFAVAYSGNLGRAHDVETLLEAISASANRPTGTRETFWIFIGGGAAYNLLRREAARRGLGNIAFYPYQPREMLAESLGAADVHLVSLKPELEGLIVPSKFYGIAAAGRPAIFIGSRDGEIARVLARYGCGTTVDIGDSAGLIEAVDAMAANPQDCRTMGERARRMCEENFSRAHAVALWHSVVLGIERSPVPASSGDTVTQPRESHQES